MAAKKSKTKVKSKTKSKSKPRAKSKAKSSSLKTRKTPIKKVKAKKAKTPAAKAQKAKARPAKKAKAPTRAPVKTKAPAKKKKQIVGEGNYEATRKFDKDQSDFVKRNSDKIPAMGKAAEAALEGPEGDSLREAEATAADRSRDRF